MFSLALPCPSPLFPVAAPARLSAQSSPSNRAQKVPAWCCASGPYVLFAGVSCLLSRRAFQREPRLPVRGRSDIVLARSAVSTPEGAQGVMPSESSSACRGYEIHPEAAVYLIPGAESNADITEDCTPCSRRASAAGVVAAIASAAAARAAQTVNSGPVLKGRYAMVTGASAGIGKGIAIGLGELGATVYVTGRRKEPLEQTAELVTRAGGKGVAIVCDHANDSEVEKAFLQVEKESGGMLDILINNAFKHPAAGSEADKKLTAKAKFYELPISLWDDLHTVSLRSYYVASYYAAPMMIRTAAATGRRPLLCVTSSFGGASYFVTVAYGVQKAASDRLVRDLQTELGPLGIDCVSLWPGVVLTEVMQNMAKTNPDMMNSITGGSDLDKVSETPVLSGRVVGQLAANEQLRKPPFVTPDGLLGRVCVVAEVAQDLGVRDGGAPGSVAYDLYGPEKRAAPSIRSLGFLGPAFIRKQLPDSLKWLMAENGPLARDDVRLPLEVMGSQPPPPPPA